MASSTGLIAVAVVLIVIIVAAFGLTFFNVNLFPTQTTTTTSGTQTSLTTCSPGGCVRKLPIQFTFINLYTNHPIVASVTAQIYRGTTSIDSITTAGGIWNSTKADFLSGDSYAMYVVSGNSKYEFTFQVPLAQSLIQPRYSLTLDLALIGTYSISVLAPDGTTIITPTTGTFNVTAGNTPQPKFTITLSNSADNTGLTSTFTRAEIPENGGTRKLTANVLVITETGTGRVIGQTGANYVLQLPDHATDRQRNPDGTLNQNALGTYSTQIQFDASRMTHGANEQITINYYAYLDVPYFNSNNVVNSEAVLLFSESFQIVT
jgi:hypothetical protein